MRCDPVPVLLAAVAGGALAGQAPHWAFTPPRKEVPAAVPGDAWCRDELDRFVLARHRREGLTAAPPAEPALLLRRVCLVLTGLPPTADEQAAFLGDQGEDAYQRRVDALLQSPGCAEHMATAWLDLARFADTYGYQADFECRTWPWRDWLIAALHDNLPYNDEFVRQLVAGDLLPDATQQTRLATAFFRLHRQTNEGGSIEAEWRHEYIADRVDTLGTALLGLTVGCARCHDHKSDPIAQRDYYALGSFFAIDESGLYPYSTGAVPRPALRLPSPEQRAEVERREQSVRTAEAGLAAACAQQPPPGQPMGGVPAGAHGDQLPDIAPALAHCPFDATGGGKTADARRPDRPATLAAGVVACPGRVGGALQFDGDGAVTVPEVPAFTRDDAFSLAFWLWCPDRKARAVIVHTSNYTEDADTQGYQVLLKDGRLCWEIVHYWPGSAIALCAEQPLPLQQWVHVAVTYDGSSRAAGMGLFVDGAPAAAATVRDQLDGPATVRRLELGARDRDRGFAGGRLDEFAVFDRCLMPYEVARLYGGAGAPAPGEGPGAGQQLATTAAVTAARAALRTAQKALHQYVEALPEIMVLAAHPAPPSRHVLRRGAYDQPDLGLPVQPDVPAAVLPWPSGSPRTRLGLAQWLVARAQPLVARVAVNRLWAQCFGDGLVRTPENFGRLGDAPVLRELLDALAADFVDSGWDQKAMLRRIVCSATFRQGSSASPQLRERDPDNRLLLRGPSFRLAAEVLRDQALLVSGLLQTQVGGPSVKPWQPPGLWRDAGAGWAGADYQPDTGANAHRRSLYTYRKRTAPPPDMVVLDGPSREYCVVQRQATTTPAQSLVFLNDPVFVECARALAARVAAGSDGAEARIERAFRAVCARPPRPAESAALRQLHAGQAAAFAADAAACCAVTTAAADPELAALIVVCSTLLASDAATVLR